MECGYKSLYGTKYAVPLILHLANSSNECEYRSDFSDIPTGL